MSIDQFTSEHVPTDSDAPFRLENSYTLDIDVDGDAMAKAGSMVAFTGDLSFTGKSSAEGGIGGFIKQAATGEGTPVMTIEGQGHAYLADSKKKIQLLELETDDSITVNGEDVLAFESDLSYEISSMDSLAGSFAGGFTNVYLQGPGYLPLPRTAIRSSSNRLSRPIPVRRSLGAVPLRTSRSTRTSPT